MYISCHIVTNRGRDLFLCGNPEDSVNPPSRPP